MQYSKAEKGVKQVKLSERMTEINSELEKLISLKEEVNKLENRILFLTDMTVLSAEMEGDKKKIYIKSSEYSKSGLLTNNSHCKRFIENSDYFVFSTEEGEYIFFAVFDYVELIRYGFSDGRITEWKKEGTRGCVND